MPFCVFVLFYRQKPHSSCGTGDRLALLCGSELKRMLTVLGNRPINQKESYDMGTMKDSEAKGMGAMSPGQLEERRHQRRRTRVVGAFPDGNSALMLVCALLEYITRTKWGTKNNLSTCKLYEEDVL